MPPKAKKAAIQSKTPPLAQRTRQKTKNLTKSAPQQRKKTVNDQDSDDDSDNEQVMLEPTNLFQNGHSDGESDDEIELKHKVPQKQKTPNVKTPAGKTPVQKGQKTPATAKMPAGKENQKTPATGKTPAVQQNQKTPATVKTPVGKKNEKTPAAVGKTPVSQTQKTPTSAKTPAAKNNQKTPAAGKTPVQQNQKTPSAGKTPKNQEISQQKTPSTAKMSKDQKLKEQNTPSAGKTPKGNTSAKAQTPGKKSPGSNIPKPVDASDDNDEEEEDDDEMEDFEFDDGDSEDDDEIDDDDELDDDDDDEEIDDSDDPDMDLTLRAKISKLKHKTENVLQKGDDEEEDDDDEDSDEDDDEEDDESFDESELEKQILQKMNSKKKTDAKQENKRTKLTQLKEKVQTVEDEQTKLKGKNQKSINKPTLLQSDNKNVQSNNKLVKEGSSMDDEMDRRTLFVGNLQYSESIEEELKKLSKDIQSIRCRIQTSIRRSKNKKETRGYAFLVFASEKIAEKNLHLLKGKEVGGSPILLDYCGSKSSKQPSKKKPVSSVTDPLKLYVTGFKMATTEADLRKIFKKSSKIDLPIRKDGKPFGYSFVKFASESLAKEALKKLQGHVLDGSKLIISPARSKKTGVEAQKRKNETTVKGPQSKKAKVQVAEDDDDEEDDSDEDESSEDDMLDDDEDDDDDDDEEDDDEEDEDDDEEDESDN